MVLIDLTLVYACDKCQDTGIKPEPRQLFITGQPATFCECIEGESRWRETLRIIDRVSKAYGANL